MTERRSKYGARRTEYPPGSGEVYDSAAEAAYARQLDLLKAAGEIADWRRGREWLLLDGPRRADRIAYRPDFEIRDATAGFYVVDVKGYATAVFRLKAKLWRARYPEIPLHVVTADGTERRV